MKIQKSHLKELIRQSIKELKFKDQAAFNAYDKKHKMRKSTKVTIGGKDTTVGDAEKKKKSSDDAEIDKINQIRKAGGAKKWQKDQPRFGGDKSKTGDEQMFNVFVNGHDEPMKIKAKDAKSARHQAHQKIQNPNVKVTAEPAGVGGPSHANVKKKKKDGDDGWDYAAQDKSIKQFQDKVKKNNFTAKDLGFMDSEDIVMNGSSGEVEDYMSQIPDEGQDFDKAEEYIDYIRDNEMGERNDDADVIDDYRKAVYKTLHAFGKKGGDDVEKTAMGAADDANKKMDAALNKDIDKVTGYINKNQFSPEDLDPIIKQLKAAGKDTEELENFKMDIGYDMEDGNWEAVGDQLGYLRDALPSYKADISTGSEKLDNAYKQAKKLKKELKALVNKGDKEGMRKKEDEIKKLWADTIEPLEKKVKPKAHQAWQDMLGQESVKESKLRRFTVKEVRTWMKTLEENRYKKVYNSDARRVSWMVNNIGENLENMPKSMRKKWTKAQYGRERYLAKEFLKSKKQQMTEQRVREFVRKRIGILFEAKMVQLQIPMRDRKKVDKILKKSRGKEGKDFDYGVGRGSTFMLELDKKFQDRVIELLIKNRIQVKEV